MEEETYPAEVKCGNCKFGGSVEIPKGTPIEEHPCTVCGVKGLSKLFRQPPPNYV